MPTEVHVFNPDTDPDEATTPQVLWLAPGSLGAAEVMRAWQRRGDLADLGEVTGPWGAVLWRPQQPQYLVVTDPLGVQPLYWAVTADGKIAVASWLDALLDHPGVDSALDYEGVLLDSGKKLVSEASAERTRFAAVRRVPWGRAVEFTSVHSHRTVRYWTEEQLPEPDETLTLDECADILRAGIDTAIRRAIADGGTVGAHVSGGLDCSAVAVRAHQLLQARGSGVTYGYTWTPSEAQVPREAIDERDLVDAVADMAGFPIRHADHDDSGSWFWERDINRYPRTTHQSERFVLPMAKADGVTVMLSGWGGDEFASFNGREVVATYLRRGQLATAWRLAAERNEVLHPESNTWLRTSKSLAGSVAPQTRAMLRHPRKSWQVWRRQREVNQLLRNDWPAVAESRRRAAAAQRRVRNSRDLQLSLLEGGHLQQRIDGWYQTGRLYDVYYRYPLLDLDLVRSSFRLPARAYLSEGWTRLAFRRAVAAWLPDIVTWNTHKLEPVRVSTVGNPADQPPGLPAQAQQDPLLAAAIKASQATYQAVLKVPHQPATRPFSRPPDTN